MRTMNSFFLLLFLLCMSIVSSAQLVVPGADNTPAVGEMAPDFELATGMNSSETLGKKDFAGKKKVLLAFYPADFTGG
jgi:hypothetical protein